MKTSYRQGSENLTSKFQNQVTEIEMIYHHKVKAKDRPQIDDSREAYRIFKQLWSPQIGLLEECHLLLLDRSGRVLEHNIISKGSFHSTLVDPKVILPAPSKHEALPSCLLIIIRVGI